MADRKQTPDVLGDILGGAPPQTPPAPEPAPPSEPKPARQAGRARPRTKRSPKTEKWEYLLVSFQEYKGWRPRFVNGQEQTDWMNAPRIHEYAERMGEEGWELTSASAGQRMYGLSDQRQLFFKRPKR